MSRKRAYYNLDETQPFAGSAAMVQAKEPLKEIVADRVGTIDVVADMVIKKESSLIKSNRLGRIHIMWVRRTPAKTTVYGWIEADDFAVMFQSPEDKSYEGLMTEARSFLKNQDGSSITQFSVIRGPRTAA